jgi:hypothetical protein
LIFPVLVLIGLLLKQFRAAPPATALATEQHLRETG